MGWEMCRKPPTEMTAKEIKHWQQKMVNNGYNLTVQELAQKLKVTTAYISTNISSKVKYINYQGYSDNDYSGNILLNRADAYDWLYQHSTFTRKTVWLNPYKLGLPDEQVTKYLDEYNRARKKNTLSSHTPASDSVPKHKAEEYYERELELSQQLMQKLDIPVCEVHERKRTKIADIQVDKFPYMSGFDLKFNKDFSDVNQCHRRMFRQAAIKILISTSDNSATNPTAKNRGKVLFVEQPHPVGRSAILYPAEIAYTKFPEAIYPLK